MTWKRDNCDPVRGKGTERKGNTHIREIRETSDDAAALLVVCLSGESESERKGETEGGLQQAWTRATSDGAAALFVVKRSGERAHKRKERGETEAQIPLDEPKPEGFYIRIKER